MKIALFTLYYVPLSVYGVERHNERLASYLSSKGHFVMVFTRGDRNFRGVQYVNENYVIYRTPFIDLSQKIRCNKIQSFLKWIMLIFEYTLFSVILAPKFVKKFNLDILYGNGSYFGGWQAALVHLLTKRPFVVVIHGSGVDYYKHYSTLPIMYHFLKWAAAIIVQKTSAIRILMKWGIPKEKIFYVEEGAVDTELFKPIAYAKSVSKHYIAFVGRLIKFKDPELLIEAAPLILREKQEAEFLFAGDGPLRPILEEKVKKLSLEKKVHFLGVVQDVRRIYHMSDVFVALSPYNNFSDLAMLEAMSCGLPVVATNSGETYKIIKDGWNGFLIEPKNAEQLKEKILLILNNPSLAKQLGKNARKTVLENYSLNRFINETLWVLLSTFKTYLSKRTLKEN